MKKFISFEEFVNEKYESKEKNSINEFGPLAGSGNTRADALDKAKRDAAKKSERSQMIYVVGGKYSGTYKLSKRFEDGNTYAAYYNGMPQDLDENKVDESIDSRVRSKIVVHLKNQGIAHREDYEYSAGTFFAKNMDIAQNIATAAADKFRVVIYDDRITKDGKVPMMIVENESQSLAVTEVPATTTTVTSQAIAKPIAKEDIKGFHKLDSIKKDIENSKVALEKMKTLIDQGVKDKRLTENYIKLLEHRTNLITEMNRIIEETKQTITNKQ